MLRLAIAGGNIGASALLSLLRGDANTELIGLYETKPDSPGVILARKWNIPVFEDVISFCAAGPEMVINITGNSTLSTINRDAVITAGPHVADAYRCGAGSRPGITAEN